ncbi:uncharacterized protein ACRADG_000358 [Cochliomyia hominivorax]
MSIIAIIYYNLNLLFGIFNTTYNFHTRTFNSYHWPILIYNALLHVFLVNWLFWANYFYLTTDMALAEELPIRIIDITIAIISNTAFLICMLKTWLKRLHIREVLQQFKYLYENYFMRGDNIFKRFLKFVRPIRAQLLSKCFAIILHLTVYIMDILDRTDLGSQCEIMECDTKYMISTTFFSFVDLYYVLFDLNIHIGLVFIYMCMEMLMETLTDIEINIKQDAGFQKYRNDILLITQMENYLKNLTEKFIKIFEHQLLLILLTTFLNLMVSSCFLLYNIFSINKHREHYDRYIIMHMLIEAFMILMSFVDIVLMFNICESLINIFKQMSQIVYEIFIRYAVRSRELIPPCGAVEVGQIKDFSRSLEFLMLQIQYRELEFNIGGFFCMRNDMCISIIETILFSNLISLIQSLDDIFYEKL